MEIIIAFSLFCLSLYILTIVFFLVGFNRIKPFDALKVENGQSVYISVIVPFKNEELHLLELIEGLKNQSYNKELYEVIFVNDHSSDNSEAMLSVTITGIDNFKLINQSPEKSGKKEALKTGIAQAKGTLIVTTDADCRHQENWVKTIALFYLRYLPKLIIAPVVMTGKGLFEKLQSLEFFSLIASGAGASGLNRPILCNGANLAYEKAVYEEFEDAMYSKEVSGDDVFLMHAVKRNDKKGILFLKSKEAVVYTQSEPSLKAFIKQRTRWASKSRSYTDVDTIYASLLVLMINLMVLTLFVASVFLPTVLKIALMVFAGKSLIDLVFLFFVSGFFNLRHLLKYIPILVIVYPFYIVFTVLIAFRPGFRKRGK
jgi:cellulose synthase/poly-beta-1,6-N-acetylglucosamine synthase-like glycosyltransferase